MLTIEAENKKLIKDFFAADAEFLKGKKPGAADPFHSSGVIYHTTQGDWDLKQLDDYMLGLVAGIPDYKYTVLDIFAKDNKVAARYQFSGTHTGQFMNFPASGKKVSIEGMAIFRMSRGKVAEAWMISNEMSLMQQVGAIPMGKPK
jgi:steroid delta-isomerase-like uncharacterized protein